MSAHFTIPAGYLFSAICVGIYAWSRFDTPATWRSTTTKWRYSLALLGYVAAAVGIWLLVTKMIETNPGAVRFVTFGGDIASLETIEGLSAAFAAALFLTVLLPNVPLLSRVDGAIQTLFRELGAIPRKARQLSSALRRAPFSVPEGLREEVQQKLREQNLDPDRLMAAEAHSEAWRWVRIVALMTKLEDAVASVAIPGREGDAGAPAKHTRSAFIRHRVVEYEQVCASYRRLATLATIVLDEESTLQTEGDRHADRLEPLRQAFRDESKALFRDLSHLISCGVLSTHFSMHRAREHLKGWGFAPIDEPGAPLIGWNDLVGLALAVTCYMFALFLFVRSGDIGKALFFSFLIGLTMTIAALCAGLPKRLLRRGFTSDQLLFGLYLVSALLAALAWFGIHYVRLMLTEGESVKEVLAGFTVIYPFALLPAAAAFLVALVTDLGVPRLRMPYWLARFVEGFIHAAALAAVAYVTATWVAALHAALPPDVQAARRPPPPAELIVLIQLGLGFIIGGLVPHLYRKAAERAVSDDRLGADEERLDRSLPQGGALLAGAD